MTNSSFIKHSCCWANNWQIRLLNKLSGLDMLWLYLLYTCSIFLFGLLSFCIFVPLIKCLKDLPLKSQKSPLLSKFLKWRSLIDCPRVGTELAGQLKALPSAHEWCGIVKWNLLQKWSAGVRRLFFIIVIVNNDFDVLRIEPGFQVAQCGNGGFTCKLPLALPVAKIAQLVQIISLIQKIAEYLGKPSFKKTSVLWKTFIKWWPPPVLYLWNPYSDF